MKNVIDAIMLKLSNGGYVSDENYEIVRYGLELNIMKLIISSAMLIVAVVTNSVLEVVTFMLVYQPLRSSCGGYHARTQIACITSSLVMLGIVIILGKIIPYSVKLLVSLGLMVIGVVVIVCLAPVDTPAKPFDYIEQVVFRKRTLIITAVLILIYIVLLILDLRDIILSISFAIVCAALLLILGKIKK